MPCIISATLHLVGVLLAGRLVLTLVFPEAAAGAGEGLMFCAEVVSEAKPAAAAAAMPETCPLTRGGSRRRVTEPFSATGEFGPPLDIGRGDSLNRALDGLETLSINSNLSVWILTAERGVLDVSIAFATGVLISSRTKESPNLAPCGSWEFLALKFTQCAFVWPSGNTPLAIIDITLDVSSSSANSYRPDASMSNDSLLLPDTVLDASVGMLCVLSLPLPFLDCLISPSVLATVLKLALDGNIDERIQVFVATMGLVEALPPRLYIVSS